MRTPPVRIALLGPLAVHTDSGEALDVGGARLRALLILLALEPGQVVPTTRLVDALWRDRAPAGAANALQALVSRLRRAVPGIDVSAHPTGYRLRIEPEAVDLCRFERLARSGRARLDHDAAGALAGLREALGLWRGPALADVADEPFAQATVAWLDELRLTAVQDRIEAELRLEPTAALVAELESLVVSHPLREPLVAQLMRAQHALGRRGAALLTYEATRNRLTEELGTDPSAALTAVHTDLLRAEPAAPAPTNLRVELTSFVGRDEELAEVGRRLDRHRLTTLTGPGGAGKTRLAIEAARGRLDATPDGVWLVELAPVTDPGEVVQTALATLGLREAALVTRHRSDEAPEPLDRLLAALRDKRTLLVLDNCEHLVAAAATLADRILRACPGVHIVATSREPLGIDGEHLWPVGPLSLPPPQADPTAAGRSAAVRLFSDRAAAVSPGFAVTDDTVDAVVRTCRALDGIPLAIELAAARLRAMAPDQVAARLDDRFRLLTGGSRTALPRHRTLRAVVDWSWDLLDGTERAVFRRLSVFTGGATLAAVEAVCGEQVRGGRDLLDVLTALVDKSLVVARHARAGTRYHLLETLRAYGDERLVETGERAAVRTAHAAYFLALSEAAVGWLQRGEQVVWLDRLAADHDNLNTALRHATASGDAATAVRLVGTLGWYWWLRGFKVEGADLAAAALKVPGDVPTEDRAVALTLASLLIIDGAHNTDRAAAWFNEAAALAELLPPPVAPVLRLMRPMHTLYLAVVTERQQVPIESFDRAIDDPDPWVSATARVIRAHLELNFGRRHDLAEQDFQRALDVYRGLGERWGMAFSLNSLALVESWRGEFATAAAHLDEALDLAGELGVAEEQVQFRARLAVLRRLLGDHTGARSALDLAQRGARRIGLPDSRYWVAHTGAELARLDGDLAMAADRLADAVAAVRHPAVSGQGRAIVASAEGSLAAARGDLPAAADHHARALRIALDTTDSPVIAYVLVGIADLELRRGRPDLAAALIGGARAVRGGPDRSQPDEERVASAARAVLGDTAFGLADRRGLAATVGTVPDLAASVLTPGGGTPAPPAERTPR